MNLDAKFVKFEHPIYIYFKVPDEVKLEIQHSIDTLEKNESTSADTSLAGHLEQQWYMPATPELSKLMETLPEYYINGGNLDRAEFAKDVYLKNNLPWKLMSYWVNYSKKGDFQPLHNHTGAFSFVIWVKIPYNIKEEHESYNSNQNCGGGFGFSYLDPRGRITTDEVFATEWEGCFFPSWLYHKVHPFKTTDDYRISISGNVFLDGTNETSGYKTIQF